MRELTRRHFVRNGLVGGAALSAAPVIFRAATEQSPQAPAGMPTIRETPVTGSAQDKYAYVDPELIPFLKTQTTLFFDKQVLVEERKNPASFPPLPAPAPQPYERRIPGPAGAPDLRMVIVDPAPGAKNRPAFLNIHGGGYIAGFAGWNPPFLQTAAMSCGCVVVSPDYRLAPETPFPGSLEDNYATLRWLNDSADTLGVDRTRIAVGGESAGGGHSAALAIAARDRKEFPILFQLLIYPMLDDRTGSTRPVPGHIGQFVWNSTSNRFGWSRCSASQRAQSGCPRVPSQPAQKNFWVSRLRSSPSALSTSSWTKTLNTLAALTMPGSPPNYMSSQVLSMATTFSCPMPTSPNVSRNPGKSLSAAPSTTTDLFGIQAQRALPIHTGVGRDNARSEGGRDTNKIAPRRSDSVSGEQTTEIDHI